jgi:hypothetical protein
MRSRSQWMTPNFFVHDIPVFIQRVIQETTLKLQPKCLRQLQIQSFKRRLNVLSIDTYVNFTAYKDQYMNVYKYCTAIICILLTPPKMTNSTTQDRHGVENCQK